MNTDFRSIRRIRHCLIAWCLSTAGLACTGVIGEPGVYDPEVPSARSPGDPSDPANPSVPGGWSADGGMPPPTVVPGGGRVQVDFACDGAGGAGPDAPMRRLSRRQLGRTIEDVFEALLGPAAAVAYTEIESALTALPVDQRVEAEGGQHGQQLFLRSDQSLGEATARSHVGLSEAIATALAQPARLDAMGLSCLTNADVGDDGACLDELVRRVGELTHRRPLDSDEQAFYRGVYPAERAELAAIRGLLTVLFAQPHFLFHVEGAGDLSAYEAASRLSYQFWDTMPDQSLMDAAASGILLTSQGWAEQTARVVADPRARAAIESFLLQWLRFDQLNEASSGNSPDFDAITGGLSLDASFDQAVREELIDLFMHVLQTGGTFEDFFLSEVTTTRHPELARIYGVSPSQGAPVAVPAERRGILTRAGLLLARSEVSIPQVDSVTHPILRGVFVLRQITCQNLPPAPAGAMNDLPPIDRSTMGAREASSTLTSASGCASCHSGINAAGFALEAFDPIGQHRTEEQLFDRDGSPTTRVPVNDEAVFPGLDEPVRGGAQLGDALYASESVSACFARHYARFTLGRYEDLAADGCMLAAMDEAIDAGQPLREVIASAVLHATYRTRVEN